MSEAAAILDVLGRVGLLGTPFEHALHAVLAQRDPLAVPERLSDGLAVIRFPMTGQAALLVYDVAATPVPPFQTLVKTLAPTGLEVCLVSDDAASKDRLRALLPAVLPGNVAQFRMDSTGALHAIARVPLNKGPLYLALTAARGTTADWTVLDAQRNAMRAAANAALAETHAFAKQLETRPVRATKVLLAAIVMMFVLEMVVSTSLSAWDLRRLGALDSQRVLAGEVWRLFSCTFLHGSVIHLAFNGIVLFSVGGRLEQILGTARFLTIYTLSGLAGSLVSAVRLAEGGVSVGASGALWGLLAAEAALVLLPSSPLPALIKKRARQGVMVNLGINVMISFLPHVDFAAHFGGGLAGAVVMVLLVRSSNGKPGPLTRAVATIMSVAYAAGLVAALAASNLPQLLQASVATSFR